MKIAFVAGEEPTLLSCQGELCDRVAKRTAGQFRRENFAFRFLHWLLGRVGAGNLSRGLGGDATSTQ
jgi:hypothetical protein